MAVKRVIKPMEKDLIAFLTDTAGISTNARMLTIRKALFCAQILTMDDLKNLTLYNLMNIKGIGEKSCDELIRAMERNKIDCCFVNDARRVRKWGR